MKFVKTISIGITILLLIATLATVIEAGGQVSHPTISHPGDDGSPHIPGTPPNCEGGGGGGGGGAR